MKKTDTQFQTPNNNKKIDYLKEPNEAHKNTLKKEITENFVEMLLDKVNQTIQEALKKFEDNKNNNMRRHNNKHMNS
jgi:hypothetical protein